MTNTGNSTDTSGGAASASASAPASASASTPASASASASSPASASASAPAPASGGTTLTPEELELQTSKLECYCRQYSDWKENNPNKIVDWTPQTLSCSSIDNDYNVYSGDTNYTTISYNNYMNDVQRHCSKKCLLPDDATPDSSSNITGDHTVNDCLDTLPNSVDSTIKDRLAYALRKEHNLLNKLAQKIVSIKQNPNPGNELLLNIDNNLQKNINLNNEELKRKARSINTKKRMLLYDEETDRLYRMIIFILKFLLLVISIVTIKLIYDY